jgi:hypothetical protein
MIVVEGHDLQRSIDTLTREIRSLRDDLVRKDVYLADEGRRDTELKNIKEDVATLFEKRREDKQEDRANRRLLVAAFLSSICTVIINLYSQAGGKS